MVTSATGNFHPTASFFILSVRMAHITNPLEQELPGAKRSARRITIPRVWLADIAFPFLITRLFILIIGGLAMGIIPQSNLEIAYHVSENPFLDMWSRWDAMWYIRIAQEGYSYIPGEQSSIAFYPLYPALLRGLSLVMTLGREPSLAEYTLAGLIISNIAFLFALTGLYKLTELEFDTAVARRAVWFLAIYPGSLFLSAPYAEPVFLALIIGSFYLARRHSWGLGGYVAFLAAISRLVGAFAFVPFFFEVFATWRRTRQIGTSWIAVLLPLFGAILFPAYLYIRFGDPLAVINVQKAWHREPGQLWDTFFRYFSEPTFAHAYSHSWLDFGFAIFALIVLALGVRLLPLRYTIFAALCLFASIGTGTLTSIIRHSMGAFPLFITLAWYGRYRHFYDSLTVASLTLLGLLTALWALWFWVA